MESEKGTTFQHRRREWRQLEGSLWSKLLKGRLSYSCDSYSVTRGKRVAQTKKGQQVAAHWRPSVIDQSQFINGFCPLLSASVRQRSLIPHHCCALPSLALSLWTSSSPLVDGSSLVSYIAGVLEKTEPGEGGGWGLWRSPPCRSLSAPA